MVKRLIDYLKVNNFEGCIGKYSIEIMLHEGKVILLCDHDEYVLEPDSSTLEVEIQDIMYDNYETEIRFCEECGIPYDAGYMAGCGDWYCCEECFEPAMNKYYKKWKVNDSEGVYGGFYSEWNGTEWEDTGIYYTEWN